MCDNLAGTRTKSWNLIPSGALLQKGEEPLGAPIPILQPGRTQRHLCLPGSDQLRIRQYSFQLMEADLGDNISWVQFKTVGRSWESCSSRSTSLAWYMARLWRVRSRTAPVSLTRQEWKVKAALAIGGELARGGSPNGTNNYMQ